MTADSLLQTHKTLALRKQNGWKQIFSALLVAVCLLLHLSAHSHSVAQQNTALFLTNDSVSALINAASLGTLPVGTTLTYIIEFTPVSNGNTSIGVAGYVTAYIPSNLSVIGADIVSPTGNGGFTTLIPNDPGLIETGWGKDGASPNIFSSPFDVASYDTTGGCRAAGYTSKCNARLNQLYGDTGIFYSTDSRTILYTDSSNSPIAQGTNGYLVSPTQGSNINTILGQSCATTHNLWDALQTDSFGSSTLTKLCGSLSKTSGASILMSKNGGTGPTPYFAGSAVAGPLTGYQLDQSGSVGPWQRIAYTGSRIGLVYNGAYSNSISPGPATSQTDVTAVGGVVTSLGYTLTEANPLPDTTNAVRWALGQISVGSDLYVRLKTKVKTASTSVTLSAEVFGGDSADPTNVGKDNTWRYHVPSVASVNSSLAINKVACTYDPTASTCAALNIARYYPPASTITYQISAVNFGSVAQTNVVLKDIIDPCTGGTIKIGAKTGTFFSSIPLGDTAQTCVGNTWSLGTIAPYATGTLIINIPSTTSGVGTQILNIASVKSTQNTTVTASASVYLGSATMANLQISKTNSSSSLPAGTTTNYSLVVSNSGPGSAPNSVLKDIPDSGLSCTSVSCASNSSTGFVCPTTLNIATLTGSSGVTIPTFNANTSGTFTVTCKVLASGQ